MVSQHWFLIVYSSCRPSETSRDRPLTIAHCHLQVSSPRPVEDNPRSRHPDVAVERRFATHWCVNHAINSLRKRKEFENAFERLCDSLKAPYCQPTHTECAVCPAFTFAQALALRRGPVQTFLLASPTKRPLATIYTPTIAIDIVAYV